MRLTFLHRLRLLPRPRRTCRILLSDRLWDCAGQLIEIVRYLCSFPFAEFLPFLNEKCADLGVKSSAASAFGATPKTILYIQEFVNLFRSLNSIQHMLPCSIFVVALSPVMRPCRVQMRNLLCFKCFLQKAQRVRRSTTLSEPITDYRDTLLHLRGVFNAETTRHSHGDDLSDGEGICEGRRGNQPETASNRRTSNIVEHHCVNRHLKTLQDV